VPELPDIAIYLERLGALVLGRRLLGVRVLNPFVLRSVTPPLTEVAGRRVDSLRRIGKRIVIGLDGHDPPRPAAPAGELYLVIHLMIAGRLRWRPPDRPLRGKLVLAVLDFDDGTLAITEAGSTRRASLTVVDGDAALAEIDRGGLEPLEATRAAFGERLASARHTLKRALTDPRIFSGIGNAYSDEILHRARLSPTALAWRLGEAEVTRLYDATRATLVDWTERLRTAVGDGFPEKVTAFRDGMAVHGRYRLPCPDCGAPVQRIVHADNETNYCARCQTGGRLLADRALSRLLGEDWPRSIDELE
jgi:formamidopyrimidine-DNA glycosylase